MLKKLLIGIFAISLTAGCMYLVIPSFANTLFISLDKTHLEEETTLFDNKYKELENKYKEVKKSQDINVSNVDKKIKAKEEAEARRNNTYNNYSNSSSGRTSSSSGR